MTSINLGKFAESLGLATTPRVRFLDRQNKLKSKVVRKDEKVEQVKQGKDETSSELKVESKTEKESEKEPEIQEFGNFHRGEADSGDEEDIFTVKRRDHNIDDNEDEEAVDLKDDEGTKKSKQVMTKAQVAKKLLKKKIKANVKINFDEEGEAVDDSTKQKVSLAGKKYEEDVEERLGGGIDIKKAKEIMSEEDRYDLLIIFSFCPSTLNAPHTGLTRQPREHELRRSTGRRRERRRKRTGGCQRQPGVKRMKVMVRRRMRRAVNLILAGFRILTCCMVRRVTLGRRKMRKEQRRRRR